MSRTRTIHVDYLPRVEGEGSLHIRYAGEHPTEVKLTIFEPPRLFEGLLVGRNYLEVPDIVSRICGICPVAYQMSAVHALEALIDEPLDPAIRALRRLLYCGEWIESHALHVFLLHAPDFLGCADVIEMARSHKDRVQAGLALKKAGNDIVTLVGGREIHPVNVRVGGFYRLPRRSELQVLIAPLQRALDTAVEAVRWVRTFEFPEFEQDYEFVALSHPHEYPMNEGRVQSSEGLDIPVTEYLQNFAERQVAHSNALHSFLKARGSYLVGPLARFHLSRDRLTPVARELTAECGLSEGCRNPFRSIVVRGIETVFACEEALNIIGEYEPPAKPYIESPPHAGVCEACTEAPRGILYHRYEIGTAGQVISARIVPPTAQNQKRIEEDLYSVASRMSNLGTEELTQRCEQTIRNYDPCISCATHFLHLTVERT